MNKIDDKMCIRRYINVTFNVNISLTLQIEKYYTEQRQDLCEILSLLCIHTIINIILHTSFFILFRL